MSLCSTTYSNNIEVASKVVLHYNVTVQVITQVKLGTVCEVSTFQEKVNVNFDLVLVMPPGER